MANIPTKTKCILWAMGAGRCYFCNKPLYKDSFTQSYKNRGYIAHIIAEKQDGPRGDEVLSEQLKLALSNLILMCDEHHREIDDLGTVEKYTVEYLNMLKKHHESRIRIQTEATNKQSRIVLYGANIGASNALVNYNSAKSAVETIGMYPDREEAVEISLKNSELQDHEEVYWSSQRDHLNRKMKSLKDSLALGDVEHISLFGLAPQPLLIELGRLISDLTNVEVFQLKREPSGWGWLDDSEEFSTEYIIEEPSIVDKELPFALNLSLSADIQNHRITDVIGESNIWKIVIEQPNNDFLKTRKQLKDFRIIVRKALAQIKKAQHNQEIINVFPAVPVSAAIEIGRVWMPKADLKLKVYDQNSKLNGFVETIIIE